MALVRRFLPALAILACLATGANAQQAGLPGGFKHDSSQPIKISADNLEVRQNEQIAIFTGMVDAIQGDVRMQAEKLVVTYDPDAEAENEAGAIRRVRADGDVFISSQDNSAQGNWADYDVPSGVITMGDEVFLTQGPENAIGGSTLRIDLNTGVAQLSGGMVGDFPASSAPATGGRVQMIINPSKANQN